MLEICTLTPEGAGDHPLPRSKTFVVYDYPLGDPRCICEDLRVRLEESNRCCCKTATQESGKLFVAQVLFSVIGHWLVSFRELWEGLESCLILLTFLRSPTWLYFGREF